MPDTLGGVHVADVNYASNPDLILVLNSGFEIVSHSLQPFGDEVLLSFVLTKRIVIPVDASGI
ncbi:hypothetical protein EDF38_1297 [Frigoribacterium sp. PhB160]|nr:hypothetical protein EDF38_1297 [Frigoribacterium sp. PhB160]